MKLLLNRVIKESTKTKKKRVESMPKFRDSDELYNFSNFFFNI